MSKHDDDDDAPLFRLFWENSKLSRRTARSFAERLDEDARRPAGVPALHFAAAPIALPRPADPLATAMAARTSGRAFGPRAITAEELAGLAYAFAARPDGTRLSASAGARYPIEAFALCFRAAAPFGGQLCAYDAAGHALTPLAACPPWSEVAPLVGLELAGEPAALFVLAALPARTLGRYGERGGRFVLLEAGALAHALSLRAAQLGLAGVLAGGLHDDAFARLLGLDRAGALIVLGYAVGAPG
jgi:SagB-type dehydrogenase family enzyme